MVFPYMDSGGVHVLDDVFPTTAIMKFEGAKFVSVGLVYVKLP